ncbi:hypothetical protein VRU48_08515 [Pedobacter sp. KR3-3]|uniref:Glycosyl transferase n=1 Tax=Pedobacter albus TaxID=3113905 RepID=A0ABU7I6P1_9SPHI|nr:hypothetical protein [Pedobacter sp. KR3-3]MEE1945148.1 hypothetical protein [Pedobacter sp. KR3-3]
MIKKIIKKIRYELQFTNTDYYARFSDKFNKNYYQRKLRNRIDKLPPIALDTANAVCTICMLANHRNFTESMAALYSFCFWEKRVHLHYHEDGSLSEQEILKLREKFQGITIFRRKEQNELVSAYLNARGLTYSAKLREQFVFALRLFDMLIEKKSKYVMQCDSDVLFFKRPDEILNIVATNSHNGCYNLDVDNVYTFKKDVLEKYVKVPMVNRFNAGLFLHNLDTSFFDFIELVIKNQPESFSSWHLEQTLFAMQVSILGNFLPLPIQYDLARKEHAKKTPLVSEHYVHSTGYDFHKDFIFKLYPQYSKQ